ncbi:serine hydrolase [Leptolyngbya sp. FACHB-261]|nr:serine hydrolase [Leptolyngbya sp. FACHB-261]
MLRTIAQKSGLGSDGTISLCTGPLYCVDFNGDLQPAAAASLIKVPIALVLVSRLEATNTSLNTAIYLDPGNYTEDHSAIAIGRPQTLRYLMTEMLANSSNTATNQLIDYLGMDTINRELKAMGFTRTSVTYKVVGDQIFPQNPGTVANRITSNELNQMMQLIYTRNTTGYHAIRAALAKQYDDTMGISALAGFNILEGRTVRWLGEKTGGTSRVLGTTLAFKLGEQICYLSVTTNNPGGESQIRKAIDAVVRSR